MQQREGGAEEKGSLFSSDFMGGSPGFGLFGSNRSMMPNLFGVRDPFDDPFFTRPFGSMFESSLSTSRSSVYDEGKQDGAKGLVIQEISSDGERDEDDDIVHQEHDSNQSNSGSGKEPSVEHPEDTDGMISMLFISAVTVLFLIVNASIISLVDVLERQITTRRGSEEDTSFGVRPKASRSRMHTCKVTYGGVDGAYYTSTRTRRVDNEGVLLEEAKEADKTTGQATHKISRGIHDKGHSVTRKLNPDGNVDILQTLHNLNEEELDGFEQAWEGNFEGHKHVPKGGFNRDVNSESSSGSRNSEMTSWGFPSFGERRFEHDGARDSSGSGKTKKVIRINIE